jgi:hypothetical protein
VLAGAGEPAARCAGIVRHVHDAALRALPDGVENSRQLGEWEKSPDSRDADPVGLGDGESEHEELATDPRRAPRGSPRVATAACPEGASSLAQERTKPHELRGKMMPPLSDESRPNT